MVIAFFRPLRLAGMALVVTLTACGGGTSNGIVGADGSGNTGTSTGADTGAGTGSDTGTTTGTSTGDTTGASTGTSTGSTTGDTTGTSTGTSTGSTTGDATGTSTGTSTGSTTGGATGTTGDTTGTTTGTSTGGTTGTDGTPDPFAFSAKTGLAATIEAVSDAITISGIDQTTPVSVANGEYSIGCNGDFTAADGTIDDGDTVCVRHITPDSAGAIATTSLTIGGVSANFVTTNDPDTLMPYFDDTGTLYGYDPVSATTTVLDMIDSTALVPGALVRVADITAGTKVTRYKDHSVAYLKGGRLYYVPLARLGPHAPVQLGSFGDACRVGAVVNDYVNPQRSWITVLRNASGNCLRGGNTATAIREADGPGGSGINVALGDGGAEGIFALHEADGRIASIVTGEGTSISNSRLRRYDADLANGVDLLNLTNPDIRTSVAHEVWGRCLYLVATTSKTGVPSLVRFAADGSAHKLHPLNNHWSNTLATDADNVYFADNNDVLRLRHGQNLASAAVTVTTLPNSDSVIDMGIAGDGSLYLSGFNLGSGVKHTGTYTVASAASAAVPLQILPATSGVIASDGDLLYADDYDSSTGTRTAITVKTDGTVVSSLPNASYSPLTPGAFNADGAGLDPLLRHYIQPAKLLLLEARSPDTAVSVVDLATGHVLKAGALPTTGGSLGSARGFGRRVMLAWYSNASGASSNYDLFALDTSTSNSIAAFQNTAGDERTFP